MSKPSLLPADTSLEAARVYYGLLRRMGPAERAKRMFESDEFFQGVVAAGVRRRHPDYDDRQVRLALTKLRLGPDLFRRAFPGEKVKP